jgi:ABC-2 type transport system permease protein
MSRFLTLWRREFAANFLSPVAYVSLVIFLASSGLTFLISALRHEGADEPLTVLLFVSVTLWMTVLVTVVCMRLFAEEKRSGTLETLMTAPVTDAEVVLGKYAAALSFLLLASALAVGYVFLLAWLSPGIRSVDLGALAGGCLFLFLTEAFCAAAGLLVSLFTRNQIVAAICGFVAVWGVLLTGDLLGAVPGMPRALVETLTLTVHIEDFSRGLVDTRPLVFLVSGTAFLLFASVKVLESRRWR